MESGQDKYKNIRATVENDEPLKFLLLICLCIRLNSDNKHTTNRKISGGFCKDSKTHRLFSVLEKRSLVKMVYADKDFFSIYLTEKGIEIVDLWDILVEL